MAHFLKNRFFRDFLGLDNGPRSRRCQLVQCHLPTDDYIIRYSYLSPILTGQIYSRPVKTEISFSKRNPLHLLSPQNYLIFTQMQVRYNERDNPLL